MATPGIKLNNWVQVICLGMSLLAWGCHKDADGPSSSIQFEVPEGWPAPVYQFANNEVTDARFQLGRKLFYDNILSRDQTVSCGSCHLQAGAFSHIDHRVSHGIDNLNGTRNSPALFNLAWQTNFFWDGGVNHLELQPINPIQNPVEMDETLSHVLVKLNGSSVYKSMFRDAYGTDSITSQLMLRALAQFMAVMVSADSRYDRYMRGEQNALSASELSGLNLFRQHCASCHKEPLFTDLSYKNNGLDSVFADSGRAVITLNPADMGKFKVPSLRNVEVSYPYMHDGSINTLGQVIEHYRTGIVQSPTLDPQLTSGVPLTTQEKTDLVNFLKSLTDQAFLHNPDYAEVQ